MDLGRADERWGFGSSVATAEPPAEPDLIRVALVDDDPENIALLGRLLAMDPGLVVVGTALDPQMALAVVLEERPQVVVMDVRMPNGGGAAATRRILEAAPETKVLAHSSHDDRESIIEMLRAGAAGYLLKGSSADEIRSAIATCAAGGSVVSPTLSPRLVEELSTLLRRQAEQDTRLDARREQLQRAMVEPGGFSVVFQPIVELRTGRIVGIEALSRFHLEPARPPDAWFAEASALDMLLDLESAAITRAASSARSVLAGPFLSLNVSPETLLLPELQGLLRSIAEQHSLVLELTEHAPVEDYEALNAALRPLREMGARLAIDDAGAGFASLRHIVQLEPDFIKLDMVLTRGIHEERPKRAMASALIAFAGETGCTIIAEGIEEEAEKRALLELGVPLGQGYLLGRPAA